MAKTIINIDTLNINIGGKSNSVPGFLEALLGSASIHAVRCSSNTEAPANTADGWGVSAAATMATAEAAVQVTLSADQVLAFLRSDERFTLRSLGAIKKHFADVDPNLVEQVLTTLVGHGRVAVKRRRSDGADLFKATVFASTQASAAPAAGQLDDDGPSSSEVYEFLHSDHRYIQRTADSIVKHFKDKYTEGSVRETLQDMVDDEELYTRTRRADGATLYSA